MTWAKIADGPPVQVQAYKITYNREPHVQLAVGNQVVFLSEEDAASLGGYLLGVTNNPPEEKVAVPAKTITASVSEYEKDGA